MEIEAVVDYGSLISAAKIFRSSSGDHKSSGTNKDLFLTHLNHSIIKVGKALQDHLVQPPPYHQCHH